MCCCGRPTINGEIGYKWNNPDSGPGMYPVNPPELKPGDQLLRDEPGRCGGSDSHSHHYRLVKVPIFGPILLVRHGGGQERIKLSGPILDTLLSLDSTALYWTLGAIYHAYSDGANQARSVTASTWRKAAAEKRIKTRKVRGSDSVKVWIERATATT
jgi:hypothetical protein